MRWSVSGEAYCPIWGYTPYTVYSMPSPLPHCQGFYIVRTVFSLLEFPDWIPASGSDERVRNTETATWTGCARHPAELFPQPKPQLRQLFLVYQAGRFRE